MARKNLFNQLELAYAPLSAYEFALQKDEAQLKAALNNASLYILGQRPIISFEELIFDESANEVNCQIRQIGNSEILRCQFSLRQAAFGITADDNIGVAVNFFNKKQSQEIQPLRGVRGFSIAKEFDGQYAYSTWISPEILLKSKWANQIDCEIHGDTRSFTKFKVHYVGKATRQNILNRIKGHSTLQDILSLEAPVTNMQLPANEIVVLPFQFRENLQMQTFGDTSEIEQMIAAFRGDDYPQSEKIFLDAEKALVKAMTPHYNKELFNNYPISRDGLYHDKYDVISYTFVDPISLVYSEGEIVGGITHIGGDTITVLEGKDFKLRKHE